MSLDYGALRVLVYADTSPLRKQVPAEAEVAGEEAGAAAGGSFGSKFASVAVKAMAVIGAAEVVSKLVEAGEAAAKVTSATGAVIAATGGAARVTAGQVSALADQIMRNTGIDKESIQAGSNMLLTFRNVRNETGKGNDIFDQANVALTNMTAAMSGGNVTSEGMRKEAIQLGKALNDPITGMTALHRVGVQFTAGQTEQVKAMVKAGNTLGAQKIILGELTKEFGGAAASYDTPMKQLSASTHELEVQMGTALLPVLDSVGTWLGTVGIPALETFGGWLAKNKQWVVPLVASLATFASTLWLVSKAFEVATAAAKLFGFTLELSLGPIGLVIIALVALGVGMYLLWTRSRTFRLIVEDSFNGIKAVAMAVVDWFTRSFVPFFTVTIPRILNSVIAWVKAHWPIIAVLLTGPFGLAAALIVRYRDQILAALTSLGRWITGTFVNYFVAAWRTITSVFSHSAGALEGAGAELIHGLMSGISGAMRGMGGWLNSVVVQPIIRAVKGFFGIHSPSTVMEGVGGNLVQGLFRGLEHDAGGMVTKVFGGWPQALGGLVMKGITKITQLPGKALSAISKVGGAVGGFLSKLFGSGGGGGSGVNRWRPLMAQVLNMFGLPQLLDVFMTQMNTESGGNPTAINLTDSNAQAGHPSQGLMQVIPGTFAAYGGPFVSRGITDPLANIYAAVAYAVARYGSNIANVLGHGHGYATGGMISEPVTGIGHRSGQPYYFGEQGPEWVSPLTGGAAQQQQHQGLGRGGATVINVYPQAGQSETAIAAAVNANLHWAAAGGQA